jgi:FkbM family methyltransferase
MLIDIFSLKFPKEVKGIIHLGAHECEERIAYLSKFNNITDNDIIWIDALENKVNLIKQKYPSIKIFNECISDTDNEVISFTVTNNYQSSSILKLKEHLVEHPDIHEISRIELKTKTLKTFYKEHNFKQDQFNFINLDIQGSELLALIGAGDILNTVDYIYIEVNTKEIYENCALLDDIDSYLGKFNFVRKNILMTQHGWGDAFYVKEIFHISNNIKIQYGTDLIKIDITEHLLNTNVNNKNIIYIPSGDEDRAKMYGDPVYGQLKNIYIETDTDSYIIDHTDKIYIDKNKNTLSFNFIEDNTINYELCVMAIFKNESLNLKTWIDHYIWQGVEHFYLIDNGSTDEPLNILQYYIDKGLVSYFFRPEKYKQSEHYRNIFDENNLKEKTKWLIICDLDEFFFGTDKKLITTLIDFNNYDVINTNSFFYGPDDNIEHPEDIRICNIYRNSDTINGNKYIFKPRIIKDSSEIWIHWLVVPNTLQKQTFNNEIYENTKIRLNHYQIQSVYFYEKIKMTRGDVSRFENEHIRTKEVFEYYKKECTIKDDILKNIIQNNIYDKNEELKFYDENNNLIDNKSIEYTEQQLVK